MKKKIATKTKGVLRFFLLLALLVASFTYAMFQGGFVSWFLFAGFSPFALYSMILPILSVNDLTVKRVLKQHEYHAGDRVEVELKFNRSFPFPLFYMVIEDEISETFVRRTGKTLTFFIHPVFKKNFTYRYTIENMPRGEYTFSTVKVKTGDLFGFVSKEWAFKQESKLLVYPSYVEMIYEPLENQYELGMTATKDKVQRDTTMAISIREYQPGDRFSWIHWKASARKNEIMTKEFEQRQSHDILLVMDRAPSGTFEPLVSYVASFVRAVIKKGAQVGLYSHGKQRDYFPPRGGESQLQTIFYHLAAVDEDQPASFAKVVETEKVLLSKNQTIIFLTTKLSKEIIEQIGSLVLKKARPAIFVIKSRSDKPSVKEQALADLARHRGIIVKTIYEGEFHSSFVRRMG